MANPNPNKSTRFQKGGKGNPKGKTSEQKRLELQNAEAAVAIRAKMLEALGGLLADMEPEEILARMDPNSLKMLKDAEDRGLGAPVQAHISPDGSMSPNPTTVELVAKPVADDKGDN